MKIKHESNTTDIENVGETGCLQPAFKQNTNDDDEPFGDSKEFSDAEEIIVLRREF